jgi:hypothetical protein
MSRTRARTGTRRRSEAAIGHLVGIAATSFLVYVALDRLTSAPDAVAMWCSGLAAGWCSLPLLRRCAAYLTPPPVRPRKTS